MEIHIPAYFNYNNKFTVFINGIPETWDLVFVKKDNETTPAGLNRDEAECYYNTVDIISSQTLHFFRPVEKGFMERVSILFQPGGASGNISINVAPYLYDDWKLKSTFTTDNSSPPERDSVFPVSSKITVKLFSQGNVIVERVTKSHILWLQQEEASLFEISTDTKNILEGQTPTYPEMYLTLSAAQNRIDLHLRQNIANPGCPPRKQHKGCCFIQL